VTGLAGIDPAVRSCAVEERVLGRTGLTVPRLGFGCGAVGGLMVRGGAAEQVLAVGRALEAGVRYFDTAPSYGDGRSEENLGRALASLDAGRHALVGTKVRLDAGDLGRPAVAVRRSLEASLRRLGRDRVNLFQLHNPVREGPGGLGYPLVLGEVAQALRQMVDEGLAAHIGFTGLGDTDAVHRTLAQGPFETVQAYFNAVNPSGLYAGAASGEQDFRGLIARATRQEVGVINIRVYAAGALSAHPDRHPIASQVDGSLAGGRYADDMARAASLAGIASELGLDSGLELGLRFALAAPGVSLVGLSSVEHLDAALRWERRGPLDQDVVIRVVRLAGAA
jgi:aryl-alcohol dehydrogenase-like predicted oxidoreductase